MSTIFTIAGNLMTLIDLAKLGFEGSKVLKKGNLAIFDSAFVETLNNFSVNFEHLRCPLLYSVTPKEINEEKKANFYTAFPNIKSNKDFYALLNDTCNLTFEGSVDDCAQLSRNFSQFFLTVYIEELASHDDAFKDTLLKHSYDAKKELAVIKHILRSDFDLIHRDLFEIQKSLDRDTFAYYIDTIDTDRLFQTAGSVQSSSSAAP